MGLVLAVLTGEAVVRDDGDDLLGRSTLGCVNHHEQLKEVVRRRDGRLDNKHNTATDSFLIRRLKFAVGILKNGGVAQRNTINFRHTARQILGGTTCKNEHLVRTHIAHYSTDF